jgi:hypothetical protein
MGGGGALELAPFAAVMQEEMNQEHQDEDAAKGYDNRRAVGVSSRTLK